MTLIREHFLHVKVMKIVLFLKVHQEEGFSTEGVNIN
jgi:hypothetical protein